MQNLSIQLELDQQTLSQFHITKSGKGEYNSRQLRKDDYEKPGDL